MLRYIEESQIEKAKRNPEYFEELVLVKSLGQVVAFMNYTFYYSSRYVFISYVGNIGKKSAAVMEVLIDYFKKVMLEKGCLAVIFEVETKRIKPKGEIARIRRFRTYLKSYAYMLHTNCYEVDFNFIQPYLLIDEVRDNRTTFHDFVARIRRSPSVLHNLGVADKLSLGFIPLQPGFTARDFITNREYITKEKLMDILRFVYGQVYGDSFIDDKEDDRKYKSYMERLLKYYGYILPKTIAIRAEGSS